MNWNGLPGLLRAKVGGRPTPVSLGFELTHLCNLACEYCDRHQKKPRELNRAEILTALAEFIEIGTRVVSLDGGEPLTHPHVEEIAAFLVQHGVTVHMNTNGILLPRHLATLRLLSKVKISLDGPRSAHDAMRGAGAFDKALRGIRAAKDCGTPLELTCVVGRHNAHLIDELLDFVESEGLRVVFQPARNSLFLDTERDGASFVPERRDLTRAFARIRARKRWGSAVGNRWSSLRHFTSFPADTSIPCAAGYINATLDPEGNLFHCGQVNRQDTSNNVVQLGVRAAFERLQRRGCSQCWCARVVEENIVWGGQLSRMLPVREETRLSEPLRPRRHLTVLG